MTARGTLTLCATLALLAYGPAQAQTLSFEPSAIRLGQTIAAELKTSDAHAPDGSLFDAYEFQARKGQELVIDMKSIDFDSYLAILEGGKIIATNDDAGRRESDSRIEFTADADGAFTILANALERGATGGYSVSLKTGGPPKAVAPRARVIRIGKRAEGVLTNRAGKAPDGSLYDLYRFTGKAGQPVEIVLKSSAFDAYLSVHRKGEAKDLAFNDNSGRESDARLMFIPPADGEYDIWANTAEGDQRGRYSLSVQRGDVAPKAEARAISYGDTVRGELTHGDGKAPDGTYYDLFRFKGAQGDEVMITMRSPSVNAYLSVRAMGGETELASAGDDGAGGRDAELPFVLPQTGVYEFWANTMLRGESGDYVVSLEKIGKAPRGIAENPPAKTTRKPS